MPNLRAGLYTATGAGPVDAGAAAVEAGAGPAGAATDAWTGAGEPWAGGGEPWAGEGGTRLTSHPAAGGCGWSTRCRPAGASTGPSPAP